MKYTPKLNLWQRIKSYFKPVTLYKYISGTRRTVLEPGSYHLKDDYRVGAHKLFVDKLTRGEIVYYEIVGYDSNGALIQPTHSTEKFKDINKAYGNTMRYTYGCEPGEHKVLVYRMGHNSIEGVWREYPWEFVKMRSEQLGIETVPGLDRFKIGTRHMYDASDMLQLIKDIAKGASNLDDRHIIEGVVIRTGDRVYKYKSDEFCLLEDIAKDSEKYIDTDEAN